MINIKKISAHCDIPCKIYDPVIIQIASLSVVRLTDLILDIASKDDSLSNQNQITRLIVEKEKQASIVKDETRIIWGDYFKEPQLKSFPETHSLVHSIMLTASKCKQEINRTNAETLVDNVNQFSEIFWTTKSIKIRRVVSPYPPSMEMVLPVLEHA